MSFRNWCAFLLSVSVSAAGVGACGGSVVESGTGSAGASPSGGTSAGAGSAGAYGGVVSGGSASVGTGGTSNVGGSSNGGSGIAGSGGVDLGACTDNSECVLEPVGCCSCGTGPVSNFTAINAASVNRYEQRCNAVDCGACLPVAYDPNNPVFYYVPTCKAGHCEVVDLKTTDATACTSSSECEIRNGTGCCESCTGGNVIALSGPYASVLSKLVCDQGGGVGGCPACLAPQPPADSLGCENGRCVISVPVQCNPEHPCPD